LTSLSTNSGLAADTSTPVAHDIFVDSLVTVVISTIANLGASKLSTDTNHFAVLTGHSAWTACPRIPSVAISPLLHIFVDIAVAIIISAIAHFRDRLARANVTDIASAVHIDIRLIWIRNSDAVIAAIADRIAVDIVLVWILYIDTIVADITDGIIIDIRLIRVLYLLTIITDITHGIRVSVRLISIYFLDAIVTTISMPIAITIHLIEIGNVGAIVTDITETIVILVALVGVG
jgi:hypothetical protein